MQIFLHLTPYFLLGCLIGVNFVYLISKINGLKSEVGNLESKLNRHYVHFENYNREIRKLLKISIHSYLEFLDQPLFDELPVYKDIDELKSILKEAGIIIKTPANISVPDPRGYSVKKVK